MSGSSDPRPGPQRLPRLPLRHRRADARPRPPGAGPGRHRADRALHPRPGLPHAAGGRLHRGTTVDAAAVDARLHADPLLRPDRGDPVRARGVRSQCRRVDSSTAKARPTGSLVLGRPDYPICLMETKPPRNTDSGTTPARRRPADAVDAAGRPSVRGSPWSRPSTTRTSCGASASGGRGGPGLSCRTGSRPRCCADRPRRPGSPLYQTPTPPALHCDGRSARASRSPVVPVPTSSRVRCHP